MIQQILTKIDRAWCKLMHQKYKNASFYIHRGTSQWHCSICHMPVENFHLEFDVKLPSKGYGMK